MIAHAALLKQKKLKEEMKTYFVKRIRVGRGASSDDITLKREINLSFTPMIGLYYHDGDFEATITEISYDAKGNRLCLHTESDHANECRNKSEMIKIKEEWIAMGWKEVKKHE